MVGEIIIVIGIIMEAEISMLYVRYNIKTMN